MRNLKNDVIGILLNEEATREVPGFLANKNTFSFSVKVKEVSGVYSRDLIGGDVTLLEAYIKAAKELENEGVKAITGNCGFLARFQQELRKALSVPFFSSSLLLVPFIYSMLPKKQKIGIITFNSSKLNEIHFNECGWSAKNIPVVIKGLQKKPSWIVFLEKRFSISKYQYERELIEVGIEMVEENPSIGAIVLECTALPPFAKALQEAISLPIFDITTLVTFVHDALVRKNFPIKNK